jgi:glycine hydroxymethyltransferase
MGTKTILKRLELTDPVIHEVLKGEKHRQQNQIEMIASENTVSKAVLEALGSEITNKTVEGYPGNRFHGGAKFADIIEQAVIDRARELFGCDYVNAQPHSGSQANQAVQFALLKPDDRILSMDLAAGGHLSHGAKTNQSGRVYKSSHYHVSKDTGFIEYNKVEKIAFEVKPKLLIAGGSAYPREIDFERMRCIANKVGAFFLVDMAHFAGLVAANVHPSPLPYADIVTLTTTKTMRGPRGGLILSNRKDLYRKLQSSVFPGIQGSAHLQVIAAKAVCLGEALQADFKIYGRKVIDNARILSETLRKNGVKIITDGTDTHLVLLDLSDKKICGQKVQNILEQVNITSNKNPIPFDSSNPSKWVGLRLGTSCGTTRGFGAKQFQMIGEWIAHLVNVASEPSVVQKKALEKIREQVFDLCSKYPIYD